jgi:hypothetical protein
MIVIAEHNFNQRLLISVEQNYEHIIFYERDYSKKWKRSVH